MTKHEAIKRELKLAEDDLDAAESHFAEVATYVALAIQNANANLHRARQRVGNARQALESE